MYQIICRFRQNVWNSRINTTKNLVSAIEKSTIKPKAFVNVSGVSLYEPGRKVYTEDDVGKDYDFMSRLCLKWEEAANLRNDTVTKLVGVLSHQQIILRRQRLFCIQILENIPLLSKNFTKFSLIVAAFSQHLIFILLSVQFKVKIRCGVVIGRSGGMIKSLYLPYFLGLGGPVRPGDQPLPWIHIKDICNLIQFCIEEGQAKGVINGVAPQIITNQEFSKVSSSRFTFRLIFQ